MVVLEVVVNVVPGTADARRAADARPKVHRGAERQDSGVI
jgi:hypothetical protein